MRLVLSRRYLFPFRFEIVSTARLSPTSIRNGNGSGGLAIDVLERRPRVVLQNGASIDRRGQRNPYDETSRYTRGDVASLQTQATYFYELLRSNLD